MFGLETIAMIAFLASPPPATKVDDLFDQSSSPCGTWQREFLTSETYIPTQLYPSQESSTGSIYSQQNIPNRLDSLKAELASYEELSAEWDGPGSQVPEPRHIQMMKGVVEILPSGIPTPKSMLSSSGEIGLYWNTESAFADLVLEGEGLFSIFIRHKNGNQKELYLEDVDITKQPTAWLTEQLGMLQRA